MAEALAVAGILWRHLLIVLPAVERELGVWQARAAAIPNAELRRHALNSLRDKRFHCQGGAVLAARPGPHRETMVRLIVALQTISDYLDNLCDRAGVADARAFRLLHRAMLDAVDGSGPTSETYEDYYGLYPFRDDGRYLQELVRVCQAATRSLLFYDAVREAVARLVRLYADLQVYKHIEEVHRVPQLRAWFGREWRQGGDLAWQEFAAACGSTLAVFALFAEAAGPQPPQPERVLDLYFPWINAWHILLDYYIDLEEDQRGGDLNFVTFYPHLERAGERMAYLYGEAMLRLDHAGDRPLHIAVVRGLPALYLSDPKVARQGQGSRARYLLRRCGTQAMIMHSLCAMLRCWWPGLARQGPGYGQGPAYR